MLLSKSSPTRLPGDDANEVSRGLAVPGLAAKAETIGADRGPTGPFGMLPWCPIDKRSFCPFDAPR
jgi:hypothetical protein